VSTAVAIRGLVKAFGKGSRAVDGVDLDVDPGSLLAILGPSGCGKTTTLKIVAGLLDATAGEVLFDQHPVTGVAPEHRSVAMVFQKPLLFPHLTVGRNVGFGLRMRKVDASTVARRVGEMLDLVRLGGFESRRAGELSGGQEQRVSLARALVTQPKVLLLDEPFSQLDANLRGEMRELVRGVQRELGVTTVFVTHDQEEAVSLADRVALMLEGRIVQTGAPRTFYERPSSLAVARFFGGQNFLPGTVAGGVFSGPLGDVAVAPGTPAGAAVLVIRQEAVALAGPAAAGAVPAVALATTYLGTHVRIQAELAGAVNVLLVVDPTQRVAPGDRLHLCFPPEHCHVVTSEEDPPS
jgi:putative spermidine/putrescine transport system ATP-binding protein